MDDINVGDVVQIDVKAAPLFAGCYMQVTEVKSWGVIGFILIPQSRDLRPGFTYYREDFENVKKIGKSYYLIPNQDNTELVPGPATT